MQWEFLEDSTSKEGQKEIKYFCNQIHSQGFCIISLPESYGWGNKMKDMSRDAKNFFKLPSEVKTKYHCWPDHGYTHPSDVSCCYAKLIHQSYEIFDVYTCYDTNFVWPSEVPSLQDNTSVVNRVCEEIAKTCLIRLAEGLVSASN